MRRVRLACAAAAALWAAVAQAAGAPTPQAKAAFERGEAALAANRLDDAAAAYKEAIAASPGYAPALNGLGSVLFKQDRKDEAIAQFKAAIAADADYKLAYFNLGYAARKSGDFATAAEAYEKYTKLEPNDPDGYYGLAESHRQLGQAEKAIAAYEGFLAREKRPSEQKWVERAKESIAALKAEVAHPAPAATPSGGAAAAPSQPSAPTGPVSPAPELAARRVADGDRLLQEKKYREASFAYQDAVNADPNNVEALFKLGTAYAILGYYAQAIEKWTRAGQVTTDPAIRKNAQDNIAKAQAKMAQAGGGSPQSQGKPPGSGPVAESTRAQARQAYEKGVKQIGSRDFAGAVASLSLAAQLEPTLVVAYVARGSAHIGLKRYAEAAADYEYALKMDGSMASPLYGLAEAYRAMNRLADARSYYEKYAASTAPDVRPELQQDARKKAEALR